MRSWSSEKLRKFPKATELTGHEADTWSRVCALPSVCHSSSSWIDLENSLFYFSPYVFTYLICIWLNFINTEHRYFLLWTSKVASFLSPLNINCIYGLDHSLSFYSAFARSWVQSLAVHTRKNSVPSLFKGCMKLPHHYFSDTNVPAQREVMICCSHGLKYIIIYLSIVQ